LSPVWPQPTAAGGATPDSDLHPAIKLKKGRHALNSLVLSGRSDSDHHSDSTVRSLNGHFTPGVIEKDLAAMPRPLV
jgi:hypothetical protein